MLGQRKLLQVVGARGSRTSSRSGASSSSASTIIEAYGALFDPDFPIPIIGRWPVLGFLEDLFAVLAWSCIVVFAVIRIRQTPPERRAAASRFYGSHTGAAWLILFMIFNVVWTLFLYRGAQINTGNFPFDVSGAFASDRGSAAC